MAHDTTVDDVRMAEHRSLAPTPGLLLVFAGGRPQLATVPVASEAVVLGRGQVAGIELDDERLSRRHAQISWTGARFLVRDLNSRNGTFVNGAECVAVQSTDPGAILRVGGTLFVTCADVNPYRNATVDLSRDAVIGPTLQRVWAQIARTASTGSGCLHLIGETGSGKELAARHFHDSSGQRERPFVAINCATIPVALAERLLFGARRGAYSGADADVDGYLQAAQGGTLFLDEIADLSLEVQAKLLRVIETQEVLPLGATRGRALQLRFCSAAQSDLAEDAAEGRFRQDLYYRIARPSVVVPALRDRREEIPWLAQWLLARDGLNLDLHPTFVEAMLRRGWPGNVRELTTELRIAGAAAKAKGAAILLPEHLSASAGQMLEPVADAPVVPPDAATIARVLEQHGGRVAPAARALGLHRTQLRRLIERFDLSTRSR